MNLRDITLSNLYVSIVSVIAIVLINMIDLNPMEYNDKWSVLVSLSGFLAAIGMYINYIITKKKALLWSMLFYGIIFISFFIYSIN